MRISRRDWIRLTGSTAAAALLAPKVLAVQSVSSLYDNTIVIDGLGFPGSMESEQGALLNPAEISHVEASGLTAIHVTLGSVGTMPPLLAFEKVVRDVTRWQAEISAHSDLLSGVCRHRYQSGQKIRANRAGLRPSGRGVVRRRP